MLLLLKANRIEVKNLWCLIALCCLSPIATDSRAQTTNPHSITNPALRNELLRMVEEDRAIRDALIKKGIDHPDKELLARMESIDKANTARMKVIIQQYGWPSHELVGKDGTDAAFLIIQHADYAFQKKMLPRVKKAYQAKELSGQDYALLLDRVLVAEGKPQVYGTQAMPISEWKNKEPLLRPIEDEANVDKRRAEVGLMPLSEYRKFLKEMYFPESKNK